MDATQLDAILACHEFRCASRNYYRPPEWGEVGKIYFSQARAERLRLQKKGVGIR